MLLLYVMAASGLCFCAFAWDKYCAIRGFRRVPEKTLLTIAAIGGTPGAFLGQRILRHKTQKQPFGFYLLAIAALQALALAFMAFTTGGAALLLFAL
jgi:uncharacterized membrane protein YsdA (DUF1294 family)